MLLNAHLYVVRKVDRTFRYKIEAISTKGSSEPYTTVLNGIVSAVPYGQTLNEDLGQVFEYLMCTV